MTPKFLSDFDHREDFAVDAGLCTRTVSRYCRMPDGLPHVEFGGKIYIGPREEARAWLMSRVRRPNRREAAA